MESKPALRKRMKVLERAHSLSNLNAADIALPDTIKLKHSEETAEHVLSPSDYETRSESSGEEHELERRDEDQEEEGYEEEEEHKVVVEEEVEVDNNERPRTSRSRSGTDRRPPTRPSVDTSSSYMHRERRRSEASPMSPTSRAWYEFDLAVVVALVSPVGNWLTGGDHIKNLLLIVLLIFYLHQIIEVPWQLYQKCRPRHRPYHLSASPLLSDPTSAEARYSNLAATELQRLETFFLLLTFFSPLLGALLLRYATAAVLGPHAVSWFSTGLFVLATGMRPWSHLVKRISDRATDLHDFVHYPSPTHDARDEQHKLLKKRMAGLEEKFNKLRSKVSHIREDVYEYVDDAMDAVDHVVKKQERKCIACQDRVNEFEKTLQLSSLRPTVSISANARAINSSLVGDMGIGGIKSFMSSLMDYLTPMWFTAIYNPPRQRPKSLYLSSMSNNNNNNNSAGSPISTMSAGIRHASRSPPSVANSSPSQCATPLETIPEEERVQQLSYWEAGAMLFAKPYGLISWMINVVGYVFVLPLKAAWRMIYGRY